MEAEGEKATCESLENIFIQRKGPKKKKKKKIKIATFINVPRKTENFKKKSRILRVTVIP